MSGTVTLTRGGVLERPRVMLRPADGGARGTGFAIGFAGGAAMRFSSSAAGRELASAILDGCDQADAAHGQHVFAQCVPGEAVPA